MLLLSLLSLQLSSLNTKQNKEVWCLYFVSNVSNPLKHIICIILAKDLLLHDFLRSIISLVERGGSWWRQIMEDFLIWNRFIRFINMSKTPLPALRDILKIQTHARTNIIIDCQCQEAQRLLQQASDGRYFNKTYQWLLLEYKSKCYDYLSRPEIEYFGPNSQIVVLREQKPDYELWDLHTKGHHLGAKIEEHLIAKTRGYSLQNIRDISDVQSIQYRGQFHATRLRGATVVSNELINRK